jgi:hypothetical protein
MIVLTILYLILLGAVVLLADIAKKRSDMFERRIHYLEWRQQQVDGTAPFKHANCRCVITKVEE